MGCQSMLAIMKLQSIPAADISGGIPTARPSIVNIGLIAIDFSKLTLAHAALFY